MTDSLNLFGAHTTVSTTEAEMGVTDNTDGMCNNTINPYLRTQT